MRKSWLLCALLGTLAFGQAAPSAPPPPQPGPAQAENEGKPPADTSASVPATAAVITINGVCAAQPKMAAKSATPKPAASTARKDDDDDDKPASASGCKTVITKAEFEKLANALAPNTTAQQRKQLAGVLPRVIAMSTEAKKEGLDKTPQFDETVKFVKMQVLTNQLQRKIQEEAGNISTAQIEEYYKEHPDQYEQYNVDRIFVPRAKQVEAEATEAKDEENEDKMTDEQKKAKEAAEKAKTDEAEQAMTKLADEIRAKAAAGEDMSKLQREAFDAAGMKIESPTVNLPSVRRTGLPPAHSAIFDLKPGEVSQVIGDSGGHYIYKMNSKSEMTLDQARAEIKGKLQNDRMRERMEKLNNSYKVDTNEAYFGPGGVGSAPPPRMPRPRPGMPPAGARGQQPAPAPAQPEPQKQ
jgi:hypothetical protein